ncbi:MAG: hypothetical protein EOP47_05170 [Sphingobacteriaceae bacterium]|nr:MAG: hypothetical protein EOP47_05170 [Sphingobacteriaceae bacterium]
MRKPKRINVAPCLVNVPDNFDADALLDTLDVSKTIKIRYKNVLHYILHTIIEREELPAANSKFMTRGYYNLLSRYIYKICGNDYRRIIDLLIAAGIINVDENYLTGGYSKGYRLASNYQGRQNKAVEISNGLFKERYLKVIRDNEKNNKEELAKIPYVTKWYDKDRLKIDVEAVHNFIEHYEFNMSKSISSTYSADVRQQIINRIYNRYNASILSVSKIQAGQFNVKRTTTDCRLHSNITSLKSELRSFLKFDGKPMVGVDIKASQPFLISQLFKQEIYKKTLTGLDIPSLYPDLHKILQEPTNQSQLYKTIMFSDYLQDTGNQSNTSSFADVNWENDFYRLLGDLDKDSTKPVFIKRPKAKGLMMIILYDKKKSKKHYECVKRFAQFFPRENELIDFFSRLSLKHEENFLPILMQRYESRLMLDLVCKNISEQLPDAPIIPVHDSILTTQEYVDRVKKIMFDTICDVTGNKPGIKIDNTSASDVYDALLKTAQDDYEEILNDLDVEKDIPEIKKRKPLKNDTIPVWKTNKIFGTRYVDGPALDVD